MSNEYLAGAIGFFPFFLVGLDVMSIDLALMLYGALILSNQLHESSENESNES